MQNILQNVEAEQALLGCILVESDLIKELSLQPEHFSETRHQVIFKAMREVEKLGKSVDMVTTVTKLGDSVEQVGGLQYLTDLGSAVASTANFLAYQTLIYDAYRLREMKKTAIEFANTPTDDGVTELYKRAMELQEIGIEKTRTKQDVLMEIYNDMHEEKEDITGINTGLIDLNAMTGGWQDGDLIVLAARPSMGKTAFALHMGKSNCEKGGVTDIFSLEMADKQLTHRLLSNLGNIEGSKWKNPRKFFSDHDYENATKAIGEYEKWNINIHDQPAQTLADIRSKIRKTKKENPDNQKHLVIIDYLQLIRAIGKYERRDLEVGSITAELKEMARAFKIPIILLSQLSRAVEQRQDKRPMMSDLRESGSIEQDADVVMFLYRDDYYNKNSELKNIIEIDLAKQRNGPTGMIQASFIKEYGRFINLSRQMDAGLVG
ncbi:replicative DNA helicase [Bacillus licheniformis]|uniref:replicative DNA helicase n=1 Tax=Bacillus licheniformis TaxID=1402 RepID=UPI0011A8CFB4|nr:replicative DNA helicase [Bacillus licheniformis]MED1024566.1 replicative DNA helicase [Bacillus licheniformis]MED1033082.1 replicative DNA helicase [Bacillus licheniformis]MED1102400.1 replicative DNA helicase [Bacillus licheniformis]MED1142405.1 replicative DNA helicase [Bacillus licheniformis]QNT74116.1 replicative DNA helicase [Bacillus licheniformis]